MQFKTLGKTGLKVSVMGVGGGGPSKLGKNHLEEHESIKLIREALDSGVNFIDTAQSYGTEEIIGKAIADVPRDSVVVATKGHVGLKTEPADFEARIDRSLKALNTDYIDIMNIHALLIQAYDYAVNEIVPVLEKAKQQGKIRYFGVTEQFSPDPQHVMLERAVQDDCWDIMMVGFNILNQSARERVFRVTREKGIGTLIMFAVRKALSNPDVLLKTIELLIERGQLDPADIDRKDPLGFLLHESGASTIPEAAYRFCNHEPGADVILSGTGNIEHMRENLDSLKMGPLPEDDLEKLKHIFRNVDSVSASCME
jgi:aryl-alcohol dehydrogenase-like predicted oxidoreductase